jgi:uncharacterized protein (TIGR03492 family)
VAFRARTGRLQGNDSVSVRDVAAPAMTRRLLFVSNGHGEDAIACKVLDRVRASDAALEIEAWPMVGAGRAYRDRAIPVVGAPNELPSEGFATLDARLLVGDLRAGWIRTHLTQARAARALAGRYDLIVAVGDVVPIAAARLARSRFMFVGCARSDYYGPKYGYTWLERRWLRRWCHLTFPRDQLTADRLQRHRIPIRFVGNPMMDDLLPSGVHLTEPGDIAIGCLPGSRKSAVENARHLLSILPVTLPSSPGRLHYLFALDGGESAASSSGIAQTQIVGWTPEKSPAAAGKGVVARFHAKTGHATATFVRHAFVDVLQASRVVIGLAGTANEQAIGLGRPLIVLPGQGTQGVAYARMKMRFFGPAAVYDSGNPATLRRTLTELLEDEDRRRAMAMAGRARMGVPGASDAIAKNVLECLGVEAACA